MSQHLSGNSSGLSILAGIAKWACLKKTPVYLRGLRAGFEESYEELIARFEQPIYGMVFRLTG